MAKLQANPNLVLVSIRLLAPDIRAARGIANKLGVPYQVWLREQVHRIVEEKKAEMNALARKVTMR